jgi:phosphoribosylformylglycinamidine synthase PurS subunit
VARVVVDVMLKPEILDPQGQAVVNALPHLGVDEVTSVRIGRRIELEFEGTPDPEQVNRLADRLLANPVIEDYTITLPGDAAPSAETVPTGETAADPAAAEESA